MDDLLPSYESAIEQDPWIHIAQYLPSEILCTAALVCRRWHAIMTPLLWGKPASHFGVQNDTVYVALTRFKRALPYVRPHVRALTHTLEFPPAHAELYGGPHAEWLRDCLEYLPRLQCLVVDGLPFFDHAALLNLRYPSTLSRSTTPNSFPVFGLRLLDASKCTNATSTGLAEALPHFPDLISLDLSWTAAAKDEIVLNKLRYLRNLRVLNLRGLGLKDADFAVIAESIGTRVRSLDICDNYLSDASARLLLDHCLKESAVQPRRAYGPQPPVDDAVTSEQGSLVSHLRKKLTGGFVGSLSIEESRGMGVTHLYLSNNIITVEGVSGLLRSRRLQVLDIGKLPLVWESMSPTTTSDAPIDVKYPGVSKLTPILAEFAATRLEYLRVNYEIVTNDAPMEACHSPRAELAGDAGLYRPPDAHELEVLESPLPELDAIGTTFVELPGNETFAAELPARPQTNLPHAKPTQNKETAKISEQKLSKIPVIQLTPEPPVVNRGAAFAPEPVVLDSFRSPISLYPQDLQNGTSSGVQSMSEALEHVSPVSPSLEVRGSPDNYSTRSSRHNSMHFVEDRRARLDLHQGQEQRLHPGMLPKVHTLVLTDVPTSTNEKQIVQRIVQYIKDAAEEASIARQRARHTYILPPGRSRAVAEQEYSRNLFGLRRIVLEMAPPEVTPRKVTSGWRACPTKSSTEDADSEAFWEAATYDFSFFDDEECGIPLLEPGRTLPLAAMSGLEVASPHPAPATRSTNTHDVNPLVDVVGQIGQFRKDRKAAYENLQRRGEHEPDVEGYWPGDITILRKPVDPDGGELDCFGNRYESGWYYR